MPSSSRSRPWPPESTTPVSARIGSSLGVRATDQVAASIATSSTVSTWGSLSAATSAAAAVSRMTVRIVPSTGETTEPYAATRTATQPRREVRAGRATPAVDAVGHAPKDLGEDDTAVAACSPQRATADGGGHAPEIALIGRETLGLRERRPHRGEHVRAGVAIGDREHVQRVDLGHVALEVRDRGRDRADEGRAVAGEPGHRGAML